jgi:nicotinamide mononucleotide transporter
LSATEIIAFLFGGAAVALAARESVWNFPVGMGMSVAFGVLFLKAGLYANAALQIVYLALAAWGWRAWLRGGTRRLTVQRASPRLLALTLAGIVVATAALYPLLRAVDDPAPFLDSLTTGMSLGAQALLNFKRLETWHLWLAVDLIYVPFYASQDLWLTAAIYVGFLGLCVMGLRNWGAATRAPAPRPAGATA